MMRLITSNLINQTIQISFDMPFDWSPEYVDLVQVVHEEVTSSKIIYTLCRRKTIPQDMLMV